MPGWIRGKLERRNIKRKWTIKSYGIEDSDSIELRDRVDQMGHLFVFAFLCWCLRLTLPQPGMTIFSNLPRCSHKTLPERAHPTKMAAWPKRTPVWTWCNYAERQNEPTLRYEPRLCLTGIFLSLFAEQTRKHRPLPPSSHAPAVDWLHPSSTSEVHVLWSLWFRRSRPFYGQDDPFPRKARTRFITCIFPVRRVIVWKLYWSPSFLDDPTLSLASLCFQRRPWGAVDKLTQSSKERFYLVGGYCRGRPCAD